MNKAFLVSASLVLALAIVTPSLAQNGRSARAEEAKLNAQERVRAIKEKVTARKAELREGVCQRRQEKLDNAIDRLHTRTGRLKTVIDTMYARVKGFYESGQLTVENYAELTATIDTASADADAAVSAVESFTITVDCENNNLGSQLDGFRTAVSETRTALKDYRKALVDLISAMNNSAKAEADNSNSNDTEEQ
jgi:hypothetical protein